MSVDVLVGHPLSAAERAPIDAVMIELHVTLDRDVDRWTNGLSCYIRFPDAADARALHDTWATIGMPEPAQLRAPWTTDYGLLEFAVIDPDGNLLRIGGRIEG